jgi:hypothetical protein
MQCKPSSQHLRNKIVLPTLLLVIGILISQQTFNSENRIMNQDTPATNTESDIAAQPRGSHQNSPRAVADEFKALLTENPSMDSVHRVLSAHWQETPESTLAILQALPASETIVTYASAPIAQWLTRYYNDDPVSSVYRFLTSPTENNDPLPALIIAQILTEVVQISFVKDPVQTIVAWVALLQEKASTDPAIKLANNMVAHNFAALADRSTVGTPFGDLLVKLGTNENADVQDLTFSLSAIDLATRLGHLTDVIGVAEQHAAVGNTGPMNSVRGYFATEPNKVREAILASKLEEDAKAQIIDQVNSLRHQKEQ